MPIRQSNPHPISMMKNFHGVSSKKVSTKGKMPHALHAELDISPSAHPQKMEFIPGHENRSNNWFLSFSVTQISPNTVLGRADMPNSCP